MPQEEGIEGQHQRDPGPGRAPRQPLRQPRGRHDCDEPDEDGGQHGGAAQEVGVERRGRVQVGGARVMSREPAHHDLRGLHQEPDVDREMRPDGAVRVGIEAVAAESPQAKRPAHGDVLLEPGRPAALRPQDEPQDERDRDGGPERRLAERAREAR